MYHYTHHRSLLNRNPTGTKLQIVCHALNFLSESIFSYEYSRNSLYSVINHQFYMAFQDTGDHGYPLSLLTNIITVLLSIFTSSYVRNSLFSLSKRTVSDQFSKPFFYIMRPINVKLLSLILH